MVCETKPINGLQWKEGEELETKRDKERQKTFKCKDILKAKNSVRYTPLDD